MHELIYTSVGTKAFSDSELLELLDSARARNKNSDITGMLIYKSREFAQILEGEISVVKDLYEKISLDKRHVHVNVFYEGETEHRSFSNWSMAFINMDKNKFESDEPLENILSKPNSGRELFLSLQKEFLST